MEARLCELYKSAAEYEIVERFRIFDMYLILVSFHPVWTRGDGK